MVSTNVTGIITIGDNRFKEADNIFPSVSKFEEGSSQATNRQQIHQDVSAAQRRGTVLVYKEFDPKINLFIEHGHVSRMSGFRSTAALSYPKTEMPASQCTDFPLSTPTIFTNENCC